MSRIVAYATERAIVMHKSYPKIDLRVQRTEKLILDALITCTVEKGFSAVSVNDITKAAGINRTTFYRHYKDKFDLLNRYAKNVYEMLAVPSNLPPDSQKSTNHQIPSRLVNIFDHVRENAAFYRVMWGRNGDPDFAEKIRMYIQKRIQKSLPSNLKIDKKRLDLFVTYSASASFGAVLWWLEHDMPYSSEEMIRILQHVESENLKTLLK